MIKLDRKTLPLAREGEEVTGDEAQSSLGEAPSQLPMVQLTPLNPERTQSGQHSGRP